MVNKKREWALNSALTKNRKLEKDNKALKFAFAVSLFLNFMLIVKVGL